MIDPEKQVEIEQGMAFVIEHWPPLWKRLLERCIEEGFNETQAFELVKTYIISQGSNGTKV